MKKTDALLPIPVDLYKAFHHCDTLTTRQAATYPMLVQGQVQHVDIPMFSHFCNTCNKVVDGDAMRLVP
jgi:hypothetical protein